MVKIYNNYPFSFLKEEKHQKGKNCQRRQKMKKILVFVFLLITLLLLSSCSEGDFAFSEGKIVVISNTAQVVLNEEIILDLEKGQEIEIIKANYDYDLDRWFGKLAISDFGEIEVTKVTDQFGNFAGTLTKVPMSVVADN